MKIRLITLAKDGMRNDIERIWRSCFPDDEREGIRYFFENKYDPNACAVFIDDESGRAVGMVHMIDSSITEDSEVVPVQYVYAAATRPDHRHKGVMRQLMEFARRYAAAKRQRYMIVVPRQRENFRYFEKMGFYRCFKAKSVYMSHEDLVRLSGYRGERRLRPGTPASLSRLSINDISSVRRDVLADREGFVGWDTPAVKYAAGAHYANGGEIVTASDGIDAGYAFIKRKTDGKGAYISEFIAHGGFEKELIKAILESFDAEEYEFRVPVYNELFLPFGEVIDYGMIRHVSDKKPVSLLTLTGSHMPYIGMALD